MEFCTSLWSFFLGALLSPILMLLYCLHTLILGYWSLALSKYLSIATAEPEPFAIFFQHLRV